MIQQSTSNDDKTLLDCFEAVAVTALASKTKRYLTCLRCVVRKFEKAFPGTPVASINHDLLDTFQLQLLQDGFSCETAKSYREQVSVVIRHYDRQLLPDRRDIRRSEIDQPEGDDADMLHVVYEQKFAPQRLLGKSARSKYLYPLVIYNLGHFLGRPARLSDLTDQNVAGMMSWISDKGRSARTVNNRRDYILSFWRWCARKRLVEEFPDVQKLPEPDRMPASWSREQLGKLFTACADQPGQIGGAKASDWWLAIHLFWWDTGERTGAVLAMTWDNFDPEAGTMYLPGDIRKTGKMAIYNIKPQTVEAFEAIREPERKRIFAIPFCLGTFYNRYTKLLKCAGLPHGRGNKPQMMRRSFASHLEAAGGNATDALQHSSRAVTNKSYLDMRVVKREAPNKLLFDIETNGNGKAAPSCK